MEQTTYQALSAADSQLIDAAKEATKKAYAPYSHFMVGSAVLLQDGTTLTGANQENKAYSMCVCAERVALLYATANYAHTPPVAIAVAAFHNGQFTPKPVTPCGECRQVLAEMQARFNTPIRILMYGTEACYLANNVSELLPMAF